MRHKAYLGLGSNLGDREAAIRRAIELTGEQIGAVEAQSALFYSEPWGFRSDHSFVNAAVRVSTTLTPLQLLDATQAIERQLGKNESHATQRSQSSIFNPQSSIFNLQSSIYHDRPIDIDILLYDDLTIDTPRLKIPHPLMRQRPFVMIPLQEVMNEFALLSTTYFGPVQWYQKLHRYDRVLIEHHETFQKQTYRNRCLIATTQGVQALTVPIAHSPEGTANPQSSIFNPQSSIFNIQSSIFNIQSLRLSDHGDWRRQHWQAIQSAYGEAPFFEYYEDDLRPFFTEHNWELLTDYNEAICRKMCELLDIHPNIAHTTEYVPTHPSDFRNVIQPKHPLPDPAFQPRPYYQVFAQKHGFLPNLSILDLLLNMGPESIFYL